MLGLIDFRINISNLAKIQMVNDILSITKSLCLLEKMLIIWIYYIERITLLLREESLATCQRKSPFEGFFS